MPSRGSIFVQIGDENVHRVRALLDEVFGDENFCVADQICKDWRASPTRAEFIGDHSTTSSGMRKDIEQRKVPAALSTEALGRRSELQANQCQIGARRDSASTEDEIQQIVECGFCRQDNSCLLDSRITVRQPGCGVRSSTSPGKFRWKTNVEGASELIV